MEQEERNQYQNKSNEESPIQMTAVVTQTAPAVKLPDGNVVSMEEYLIWLGNQIWIIRRAIG